jgi:hypothetical protein
MQSHQNYNDVIPRDRKVNSKVHVDTQKTSNSQSNPEQKSAKL